METTEILISEPQLKTGQQCEVILRSLPEWFGIEEAIQNYVKEIDLLPTFLIKNQKMLIGFFSVKIHFPSSAELLVLGILPKFHAQGIGLMALAKVESYCKAQKIKFLQVKTLSPSRECKAYEQTRKFYLKAGFQPLEEFPNLWGESNPCLQMIKHL